VQEDSALSLLLVERARQLGHDPTFRFQAAGTDAAEPGHGRFWGSWSCRMAWCICRPLWLVARLPEALPPSARLLRQHLLRACASRARWPRQTALPLPEGRGHLPPMRNTPGSPRALVREVGPRDGLQNSQAAMPTGARLRWTAVMAAAGIPGTYQPARAAA
jgi:hypothetical protein